MIDFRYHLVSIVAVFLALAIGIFVGATALQPYLLKALDRTSRLETERINSLLATRHAMEQQIASDQALAEAGSGVLVGRLLAGKSAVLVTAPGADGQAVSGVTSALQQAGVKVTGQVALQPLFFVTGASNQSSLDLLSRRLVPAGVSLGGQGTEPGTNPLIAGQQEAAQVIATAILTKDGPGLSASQSQGILSGFAEQGFLAVKAANGTSGTALAPATLAVVIIPADTPAGGDSDPANTVLISLAQQLSKAGQAAIVAGSLPGSGSGSAIDDLASGVTGVQLSSVDNANMKTGQIMVVQALDLLLTGHKPASYGVAAGTVPSPAPTAPAPAAAVVTTKPPHNKLAPR